MNGASPRKRPCASCPYRRNAPSGIWHPDEYAKLPAYDEETIAHPGENARATIAKIMRVRPEVE